jgi:Zn finger protein HypA/HybF involved in hydrogenase expression
MVRQIFLRPSWLVIVLVLLAVIIFAFDYSSDPLPLAQMFEKQEEKVTIDLTQIRNAAENEGCLKCHGQSRYSYDNPEQGKVVNKRMYGELVIRPNEFYASNHRQFKCTDCHSEDYGTFPHPGNLRMEAMANCIDCHGGDEQYAKYKFEAIDTAFMESVHSQKYSEEFTCWMCHDAHTYKITARTNENIQETVLYDNTICLSCHSDYTRFGVLTEKTNPNLLVKHEWLPNQALHFKSVRCIECHTEKSTDSAFVSHKVLPKSKAVKNCKECHSSSSELMASLYKYQAEEVRSTSGFFKGVTTGDSVAIGATRNYILNVISAVLFAAMVIGIAIHAALRYIKR